MIKHLNVTAITQLHNTEKQKEYYMDHLDKHPELYNRILKEVVVRG